MLLGNDGRSLFSHTKRLLDIKRFIDYAAFFFSPDENIGSFSFVVEYKDGRKRIMRWYWFSKTLINCGNMSQSDVESARRHLNKASELVGEKEWNYRGQKYHLKGRGFNLIDKQSCPELVEPFEECQ